MSKTLMSVRLEEDELAALQRAAAEDRRPVAAMARLMIHNGLKLRGYLDGEKPADRSTPAGKPKGRRK